MEQTRRHLIQVLAGLTASASLSSEAQPTPLPSQVNMPAAQEPRDTPEKLSVVMLAHPDMTALDLVAPQLIFATLGNVDVQLVWKDTLPVRTDSGLQIVPSLRLDQAASAPDVLFVPGGLKGTTAMTQDAEVLDFLRDRGAKARWVTSVCTGSLLLGAAGLLDGYRATSHWYVRDLLPLVGAVPVNERVVRDRNRITGGGVTAGMDFALALSALLRGEAYAGRQELVFEYAPQPPFGTGTPELAGLSLANAVLQTRRAALEAARSAITGAVEKRARAS